MNVACKYRVPSNIQRRIVHSSTRKVFKDDLRAAAYKPELVERNNYFKWCKEERFNAAINSEKPVFSMVLPPPNITGKLHLGHALACTIQDVIVRRKRSMGHNVMWLPGTDHAGIATQGVVEKYLQSKQNLTRQDLGREKFVQEVWKWKELHGDAICKQLRTLACSLDWSRQMFTMDPRHTNAVNHAFIELFRKGLIYRKKSLINWCNKLQSTVSDIEVDKVELEGPTEITVSGYEKPVKFGLIYNFAYKVTASDEELVVATTMPETMLGDTAVAVHPDDQRYHHLRGKTVTHPFSNKNIPIIFDTFVDMEFGTGAVKITPAHSKIDYDVGKYHNLPLHQVINEHGQMINSGIFDNMKRYDCRETLLQKLGELGLLRSVSSHKMSLPVCSRSGDVIYNLPKEQWFLSCKKINKKAKELVKSGKLKIKPEKFTKNWLDWTGDGRDWCISRQLWWGHQIPAYRCKADKDVVWIAEIDENEAKDKAAVILRTLPENIQAERDSDVLDTWFSSGIYPFASLGWPDLHSKDYQKFYPLSLMATGHDILGFWVHRMVILGLELTEKLPFENILLHGIVCDSKGAKMSKSKGNVIDPLDVINGISLDGLRKKTEEMCEKGILTKEEMGKAKAYHKSNFSNSNGIPECGVDALRFSIVSHDIKSNFVHFDVDLCHTNKLFGNKIWQSVKYTQLSFDKLKPIEEEINANDLTYFDRWILSRQAKMVDDVNSSIDDYDFHIATKSLKTLIYNEFCDVYLEATKPGIDNPSPKIGYAHAHTLSAVLNTSLRCLAPFMIYLTEELIPRIPAFEHNIVHNFKDGGTGLFSFPQYEDFKLWRNAELEDQVHKLLDTIFLVRQLKGFYGISNKVRPTVHLKSTDNTLLTDIVHNGTVFLNLTRCGKIQSADNHGHKNFVSAVLNKDTTVSVELVADDVDSVIKSARTRLEKKVAKAEEAVLKYESKFASDKYRNSVSEITQHLDKEKYLDKKSELEQLKKLIQA
ncbi:hypothetical protein JYU34_012502 [Plutella xylostella]|uniref:valine--tRNA ligase n=1 Tax=Plutella xylostella TaxID=51655 RepID=A0ABQ7QCH0_PLUXY|nr:hypothetical protein JYU34_012502 [Plutella xylostella]